MREFLRTRLFLAIAIAAALIGLYAWLGFKLAPKLIRSHAIAFVHDTYGRDLKIGAVRVQPFKLQLEVRDFAFPDADGKPMLSFRRFMVDFELSSIWHRAYVFKALIIEAPGLHTVVRPDGVVNLADLAPKPTSAPPPTEKSELPQLWIQSLVVSDGLLEYSDLARREPYHEEFRPVAFTLKDFKTNPQGGGFAFSARSEANEQIDWKGRFEIKPQIASQGDFTLGAVQAPGVARFLGDALPFDVSAGLINIAGSYRVTLGDRLDLKMQLSKLALSGLALRARGADADWIQVPDLELANIAVAMPEQTVQIDSLALNGLKAQCWLNPDGSVNLTQLLSPSAPGGASAAAASPATKPAAAPPASDQPGPQKSWALQVARVDLKGAEVALEDRMQAPVKRFAIAPINLHVEGASLDLAKPLPLKLDATINGHALFQLSGQLTPDPLAADLKVSLDKASLKFLQPYVLPLADLTIHDGWLNFAGKLQLRPAGGRNPQLEF